MKKYVVDSSIFIAMFLKEENSHKALEFFNNANKHQVNLLAPSIFIYEVMAILLKEAINLLDIESVLDSQIKSCLKIMDLDQKLIKETDKLTKKSHPKSGFPSFYDSSYHALAILNDCNFITIDKKHYDKTKHLKNIKLLKIL